MDIKLWDAIWWARTAQTDWAHRLGDGSRLQPGWEIAGKRQFGWECENLEFLPGSEWVSTSSSVTGFGMLVAYNPNALEFVTNAGDGTGIVWNAETGEPKLILKCHY